MREEAKKLLLVLIELSDGKTWISSKLIFRAYHQLDSKMDYIENPDYSFLRKLLDELNAERKISLPKGKKNWDQISSPSLPKKIALIRQRKKEIAPQRTYAWHPKLEKITSVKSLSSSTVDDLKKIDIYFKNHNMTEISTINMRERSLDIFGEGKENEKKLENLFKRKWFCDNFSPELFKITINPEPFSVKTFCEVPYPRTIVIENVDTFMSFIRANSSFQDPFYKYIIYGKGNLIERTIFWIKDLDPQILEISYFGDLDRNGFLIPYRSQKELMKRGFNHVLTLSVPFYLRSIEKFGKIANLNIPDSSDELITTVKWLNPLSIDIQKLILHLFKKGQRIPQEILTEEDIREIIKKFSTENSLQI